MLTPRRRRGIEYLDDPTIDDAIREQSIGDVMRANRWLGGLRAAAIEVRAALSGRDGATVLDVGTGFGDIVSFVANDATQATPLTTIGVDDAPSLLVSARRRMTFGVCASALALPFRDRSVDVVFCSQLLHHFEFPDAARLVREMNRVARIAVIISDLRRSWIAAAGFWLVSFPMRFHWVTRHDGTLSVLRGFTSSELREIVHSATGAAPRINSRLGFRLTARWSPAGEQ